MPPKDCKESNKENEKQEDIALHENIGTGCCQGLGRRKIIVVHGDMESTRTHGKQFWSLSIRSRPCLQLFDEVG